MKAMVLAAGYGTRLLPLTEGLPKPMVPVMNHPLFEHTLSLLSTNGITDIVANLHHLPQKITQHFGDGGAFGVRLHYSIEDTILGTAGGIKAAQKLLQGNGSGTFLVINSDVLATIDLKKVVEFHKQKGSILTLVLRRPSDPQRFECIKTDTNGRITHFPGVASAPVSEDTLMFTGIQIMEPDFFSRIPTSEFCGTTENVFPAMIREGLPVYGYTHADYWSDLGCREDYLQTHWDILNGKLALEGQASSLPIDHPAITPPVFVGNDCQISPSARIGPYAVLGNECQVGECATVEYSVCWDGVSIGNATTVRHSIIGSRVVVGNEVNVNGESLADNKVG
ncbi:MAG: NDP-sugar synthase [Nitrospinota bacterium]|nr:NDP-sugar synthase [Nitrospinota bacterium]